MVVKTLQKKQQPNREKTLLFSYSPTFTENRKILQGRNWKLSYISWFDAYSSSLSTVSLRSFRSLQFAPFPTRPLLESKSGLIPVFFFLNRSVQGTIFSVFGILSIFYFEIMTWGTHYTIPTVHIRGATTLRMCKARSPASWLEPWTAVSSLL